MAILFKVCLALVALSAFAYAQPVGSEDQTKELSIPHEHAAPSNEAELQAPQAITTLEQEIEPLQKPSEGELIREKRGCKSVSFTSRSGRTVKGEKC